MSTPDPGNPSSEHGKEAENAVELACKSSYLADFVVRSPHYHKHGVGSREAADLLLLFGDHLVVIQVKSRRPRHHKPSVERMRRAKRIRTAARQVRTAREALVTQSRWELRNLRDINICIQTDTIRQTTGLVVLDTEQPSDAGLEGDEVFDTVGGTPVHAFLLGDFRLLTQELDTIPDLLDYLHARQALYSKSLLAKHPLERDLLCAFTTRYDAIEAVFAIEGRGLLIPDGLWESTVRENMACYARRAEIRNQSLVMDKLIEQVHRCIGFNPAPGTSESGSTEAYARIATELSGLRRAERMALGGMILDKAKKADKDPKGFSYFYFFSRKSALGILFMAARLGRDERRSLLWKTCAAAYACHDPKKLVGIAAQNYSADSGSQDFVFIPEGTLFDDHEELKASGKELFGEERATSDDQWGFTR